MVMRDECVGLRRETSAPPSVSCEEKSLGILAFCGTATLGCALACVLTSFLRCFAVLLQKDSSISATRYFAPIEENASEPDHGIALTYGHK